MYQNLLPVNRRKFLARSASWMALGAAALVLPKARGRAQGAGGPDAGSRRFTASLRGALPLHQVRAGGRRRTGSAARLGRQRAEQLQLLDAPSRPARDRDPLRAALRAAPQRRPGDRSFPPSVVDSRAREAAADLHPGRPGALSRRLATRVSRMLGK